MKLQKLVYFAHGWSLALTGERLINEPVEAWAYGPVIPELYHEFKIFGAGRITEPADAISLEPNERDVRRTVIRVTKPTIDGA